LFKHLENYGPGIIVDYGCAFGHFTERIRKYNPETTVVGVDYQEEVIDVASRTFPELTFKKGALPEVTFGEETVDAVFLLEVLYILSEQEQKESLENIQRMLKPGGKVYFSANIRNSAQYYSGASAQALIGTYFELIEVGYVYNKMGTLPHKLLGAVASLTDLSANPVTEVGRKAMVRRAIFRGTRIPVVGLLFRVVFALTHRASISIFGSVKLFRYFGLLTQTFLPQSGGTNILIAAKKSIF
jgi:SAM-dependent methyltransferase